MLINSLVRRPAKNSPSERGNSGQDSYRVYSSHTPKTSLHLGPNISTLHQHHLQTRQNSPWVILFNLQIVSRNQTSDCRHKVWSTLSRPLREDVWLTCKKHAKLCLRAYNWPQVREQNIYKCTTTFKGVIFLLLRFKLFNATNFVNFITSSLNKTCACQLI